MKVTKGRPDFVQWSMMRCLAFLMTLCSALVLRGDETSRAQPGPFTVRTLSTNWHDAGRRRDVPVKIYFPVGQSSAAPVILFSHGLGGTRDTYEYLGQHWASHGYVSAHVQHLGSDDLVWRGASRPLDSLRRATQNPVNSANRPLDLSFVLDELTKLNRPGAAWAGQLNLQQVGAAGHSYGAFTSLAMAGQQFGPTRRGLADPRIKAAIAMSPPVPRELPERNYAGVRIPILHLTGTADESPINDTKPEQRRAPFDAIQGVPQFLVIFQGGDHRVFGQPRGLGRDQAQDTRYRALILQGTTAFWDAYLRNEATAANWLRDGGFAQALGTNAVLETKPGK